MRPLTVLLTVLLGQAYPVAAQTTWAWGPQLGGGLTQQHYTYQIPLPALAYESTELLRPGLTVGWTALLVHQHLTMALSGRAAMKNAAFTARYVPDNAPAYVVLYNLHYRYTYLTLPLTVAYTQRLDGTGWQVVGGTYLACLLGGAVTYDNAFEQGSQYATYQATQPIRAAPAVASAALFTAYYSRRLDVGLQAGLGYRAGRWMGQAVYQLGVRNLAPVVTDDPREQARYYLRGAEATLTYLWGKNVARPRPAICTPRYTKN